MCIRDSFKGSVEDVLSRFYGTAETEKPDYVIRLTSDCPLIDPNVIDTVVTFALEHPEYDYAVSYTHLDVYKRQIIYRIQVRTGR